MLPILSGLFHRLLSNRNRFVTCSVEINQTVRALSIFLGLRSPVSRAAACPTHSEKPASSSDGKNVKITAARNPTEREGRVHAQKAFDAPNPQWPSSPEIAQRNRDGWPYDNRKSTSARSTTRTAYTPQCNSVPTSSFSSSQSLKLSRRKLGIRLCMERTFQWTRS